MEVAKPGLQAVKEDPAEHNTKEDSNVQSEITSTSKFDGLVELVQTSFAEVQSSTQALLELKDELLMQFLPPTLKFKMAVIFGNMYRSLSDLNTPVVEMLRLIKIYSASWEKNSALLKKLNDMYETKKQMLNIAIKRLTLVDKSTDLFQKEKRIMNWEKLYLKLSEAKGHGRRWKFHIETFRKKSNQGYTELLNWVLRDSKEEAAEKEAENNRRKLERKDHKPTHHRHKNHHHHQQHDPDKEEELEAKSKSSFTTKQTDENVSKKLADDSYMLDVDSDQDIFSDDDSERESSRRSRRKEEKPPVETTENSAQTEPDVENVACWTGEPNYTRYFIIRLFKPQELNMRKLKFKITYGTTSLTSKSFETVRAEKKVKINEQQIKPRKFKSKNSDETDYDEKKIDTSKYEDFIFELSDFMHKSSELSVNNDDCIQFEMKSEDKDVKDTVSAFLNLPMDDVHTLDLPILYYRDSEEAQVVDYYETTPAVKKTKADPSSGWLRLNDMTSEAAEHYELLSKRTPYTFEMYKNKTVKTGHAVCKLPIMFFWVRKPWIFKFDKNTATQTLKDIVDEYNRENLTLMAEPSLITQASVMTKPEAEPKPEPIIEIRTVEIIKTIEKTVSSEPPKETTERGCSPILIPPTRPPSTPVKSLKHFDISEIKPDLTPEEVQAMQETYRLKIDEMNLTIYKLENELSQLRSLNDYNRFGKKPKNRMPANKSEKLSKSPDSELPFAKKSIHPNTSVEMKQLPKDFFERLKAFSEKSNNHHRDLMAKYMEEEANIIEQQMAVQHRLDTQTNTTTTNKLEDFCLPAVFMPFKSSNSVFNPRAHQYFHPSGSSDIRLTQPPAIFQLPPLPPKSSISVINLFDLSKRYQAGEPDYYINEYIKREYSNKTSNQKTSDIAQDEEADYASSKMFSNDSNLKTNL